MKLWSRSRSSSSSPRSPLAINSFDSSKPATVPSRSQSAEISSELSSVPSTASSNMNELPPHIQELHEAFRQLDTNGDGKISVAELGQMLRCLGENPTQEELELMVREADTDGDGFVCLDEFVSLNTRTGLDRVTGSLATVEELEAVFGVFDLDRNGYISAEELLAVLQRLGEKGVTLDDCNQMIAGVDADGDGKVDFEEFKKMMSYRF